MALIPCNHCGRMVSDKALACPNCGTPVVKKLLCEDCGNEIPAGVTACPSCGCPVAPPTTTIADQQPIGDNQVPNQDNYVYDYDYDEAPNNNMHKWIWAIAAALVMAAVGLSMYLSNSRDHQDQEELLYVEDTVAVGENLSGEDLEKATLDAITTWTYGQTVDDLTNDVTSYTASIHSKNECEFDSYGNKARMVMTLTYSSLYLSSPSTSVLFFFDDGKTNLCRLAENFSSGIRVVFDNGGVDTRWSLIESTSKRNSLFMYMPSDVKPFLAKLRSSRTCRIQVNLEHKGMTTFDFDITGLKWDYDKDNSSNRPSEAPLEEPVDAAKGPIDAAADASVPADDVGAYEVK